LTEPNDPRSDPLAEAIDRAIASGPAAISEVLSARRYAVRLFERLLPLDTPQRLLLLRNVSPGRVRAVSEHLREEARRRRHTNWRESLRLAELAVWTAEQMQEEGGATQAEALTERGNARRLAADFAGAERDFHVASRLLAQVGGDPLATAELLSLRASLAKARAQFQAAIALASQSHRLYAVNGQANGALASLTQLGAFHGYAGNSEVGIEILGRALDLALDIGDSQDILHVANNLALVFTEAGLAADATTLVNRARELCTQVGTWSDELRLEWLAARIEAAAGHCELAARILEGLIPWCRHEALVFEEAQVKLELAVIHLRLGRSASAKRFAAEAADRFRSIGSEHDQERARAVLSHLAT
jgi:tetratricopeptide (TPR) repeat protein